MHYISTRGDAAGKTFADILFEGYAADGGMYLPESYPKLDKHELKGLLGEEYPGIVYSTFRLFWPELSEESLWLLCRDAFQPKHFPYGRDQIDNFDCAPLSWLRDGVALMELANGASLSFDDHSMRFLSLAYERKLAPFKTPLTFLGATTGDMGASCEAHFGGRDDVKVVMLAPKGRMTRFQAAQLYANRDKNVLNIEIDGTFDDCQALVTRLLQDEAFRARGRLAAINTVLWARIVTQVAAYFYAYAQAVDAVGEEVVFTVPAGNFGNAFAGWVAKRMGLPIMRIIVATNENDAMDRFFRTGTYCPRPSNETLATSSPSMDISRAANFERFLFELLDRNAERVKALMAEIDEKGEFTLAADEFAKLRRSGFVSGMSSHVNRLEMMSTLQFEYDTLIDPHTADCLYCGIYLHPVGVKTICFETVQPAKSPRMIREACGVEVGLPEGFADPFASQPKKLSLACDEAAVREAIDRFANGE